MVDVERVAPDCVLTGVGFPRGREYLGCERHLLRLLREAIVVVLVAEGIDAVVARLHALDAEVSSAVGTRHSLHGQRGESRVVEVGIEADEYSLHGLQVFGIEYIG